MSIVWIILFIMACIIAICLAVKYYLLTKNIAYATQQIKDIASHIDTHKTVKLQTPNQNFEKLLVEINTLLDNTYKNQAVYRKKEQLLKNQIEYISHDLRTPLTVLLGYLKLLDTHALSEEDKESFNIAIKRATSLQTLITKFYDLSRLNNGEYTLEMTPTNVIAILEDCLLNQYAFFEQQGLDVQVNLAPAPVIIKSDSSALQRIFDNLLQNAARYAKSCVFINYKIEKNKIHFLFKNDVQKMDEETVAQLFDRFYTQNKARNDDSTGLGLTISKYLAQNMNGKLDAHYFTTENQNYIEFVCTFNILENKNKE